MPEQNPQADQSGQSAGELTPEQLRQLTEKVYALLLADLRLERARSRMRRPQRNKISNY